MAKYTASDVTYTDQELLDLVRHAIAKILAVGKALRSDNEWWTAEDLPELRALEKDLQARIDAATEGPVRNLAKLVRNG